MFAVSRARCPPALLHLPPPPPSLATDVSRISFGPPSSICMYMRACYGGSTVLEMNSIVSCDVITMPLHRRPFKMSFRRKPFRPASDRHRRSCGSPPRRLPHTLHIPRYSSCPRASAVLECFFFCIFFRLFCIRIYFFFFSPSYYMITRAYTYSLEKKKKNNPHYYV